MDSKSFFYEFGKILYKIDRFYAEYAKNSEVKENLLWILYALNDGKAHSQKEICESWDLPRSTINTIMKELENDGYVKLEQIKGKRRELKVKLTKKGEEYTKNLLNDLYEIENKTFNELNNTNVIDDMKHILNLLNKHMDGNYD